MFSTSRIAAVRKQHYALQGLPDTVRVPAAGLAPEIAAKPIDEITLDDLAFAVRGLEAEFNLIGDRLHALRKLYSLARDAGALGTDLAVVAVANARRVR